MKLSKLNHGTSPPNLTNHEFELFRRLIADHSGIRLHAVKRRLLQTKLTRLLMNRNLSSFADYYDYLVNDDSDQSALLELMDIITTNKTEFFREDEHFHFLQGVVLPALRRRRFDDKDYFLRVWCAGCATGEEAYSLAISLKECYRDFTPSDGRILATDISSSALNKAMAGVYDERTVATMPEQHIGRYMEKVDDEREVRYRFREDLQSLIEFRYLNLAGDHFPFRYRFDVIFCRNVMIYFDRTVQQRLVDQFHNLLQPGGYLFTGHAENLINVESPLQRIQASILQKI